MVPTVILDDLVAAGLTAAQLAAIVKATRRNPGPAPDSRLAALYAATRAGRVPPRPTEAVIYVAMADAGCTADQLATMGRRALARRGLRDLAPNVLSFPSVQWGDA